MNIDWKQKLSSRKFWVLLIALVISVLIVFNVGEDLAAKITAIISAFGSVVTYILAEATVDKARANNTINKNDKEEENN